MKGEELTMGDPAIERCQEVSSDHSTV